MLIERILRAPADRSGGGSDTFSSINDALSSYDENLKPNDLPDFDAREEDEDERPGSQQRVDDGQQQQSRPKSRERDGDGQGQDDGHSDLDALMAEIEGGPGDGEGDEQDDGQGGQGPQFAAPDTRIKLPDGTVTTVDALVKGSSDLATQRSAIEKEKSKFDQARNAIREQYQTVQSNMQMMARIATALMPQRPDPTQYSPQDYQVLERAYAQQVEIINDIVGAYQHNEQQLTAQEKADLETMKDEQANQLVVRDPRFGDDKYWGDFRRDMFSYGPRVYGYSAKELAEGMVDHRQYLVMRDALNWQRLKASMAGKRKGGGAQQISRAQAQIARARDTGNGRFVRDTITQGRVMTGSGQRGRVDGEAQKKQAAWDRFKKRPTARNAVDLVD